jgi:SNF2 family DNA or RNA helicase
MTGQHNNNGEQQQQEDDDDDATCPICYDHAPDCMLRDCGHTFGHSCLTKYFEVAPRKICPMCKCPVLNPQTDIIRVEVSAANNNSNSSVVDPNSSSKIIALTNFLKSLSRRSLSLSEDGDDIDDDQDEEEDDNRERALVFVQWTSLARRICKMLNANGVKAKMVIGNAFHRIAAIREFNEGKVDVLLLALDSDDNSGMDLTKANHIVFAHVVMAANEE